MDIELTQCLQILLLLKYILRAILLTADKTTVGANSNALGGSQAIKKGVSYKY